MDTIYKVDSKMLNVRVGVGANNALVSKRGPLSNGEIVVVHQTENVGSDVWGYTRFGWVNAKFLKTYNATLGEVALYYAKSEIGVQEVPKGSNSGPEVKAYLASVGINTPAPWCMAFVYWCVSRACESMGKKNPLLKSGHVLSVYNHAKKKGLVKSAPQPGDIFIMDFGGGKGHTGFCDDILKSFRFNTAEGNSNDEGSREGHEVCKQPGGRAISKCKGFIRLI
jgi:hypothetical protein